MNLLNGEFFHHLSAASLSDLDVNTLSRNFSLSLSLLRPFLSALWYNALLEDPSRISANKFTLVAGLFSTLVSLTSVSVKGLAGTVDFISGLASSAFALNWMICFSVRPS